MKNLIAASMLIFCACLSANTTEVDELSEEMICDIPYEADYIKCLVDEENAPTVTEKEEKLIELEPFNAKGKFFINHKKRQLQVWLGRAF